jgi:hypothetical protein
VTCHRPQAAGLRRSYRLCLHLCTGQIKIILSTDRLFSPGLTHAVSAVPVYLRHVQTRLFSIRLSRQTSMIRRDVTFPPTLQILLIR